MQNNNFLGSKKFRMCNDKEYITDEGFASDVEGDLVMSDKMNITYSDNVEIDGELKILLEDIISSNQSKWIIALEAYFLGVKTKER